MIYSANIIMPTFVTLRLEGTRLLKIKITIYLIKARNCIKVTFTLICFYVYKRNILVIDRNNMCVCVCKEEDIIIHNSIGIVIVTAISKILQYFYLTRQPVVHRNTELTMLQNHVIYNGSK